MECIQNRSETVVVENFRQDFRSENLLVDATQVFEEEIHLVMCEHSIVQTEVNLNYTITGTKKEHRSLAFATSKQTSEELGVQVELLQESATVSTVLQHVQQGKLFRETRFYASNLLLEEGNKCFKLDKTYGFVHEQQFALQDNWNEEAMHQKLCQVAIKHEKPVNGNAECKTQAMNAFFGK